MKIKILLITIVFALNPYAYAASLQEQITQQLSLDNITPLNGVILVAQDGKLIYEKSSGNYGAPNINSQFIIGSISKQITAVLVLQLVDQGLVDLDQPIGVYLPDLKEQWAFIVTLKQLLNHSSGVVAMGQDLAFKPGIEFKYSPTLTYYLLSKIAENVSGRKYRDLLNDLFKQAKMQNSTLAESRITKILHKNHNKLAQGYREVTNSIAPVDLLDEGVDLNSNAWIHPGGGIISTAYDLLAWNIALHNGKLLSQPIYEKMITASSTREHPRYGKIGYGFGVQLVENQGHLEISHSGYIDGYTTTLIYYPTTKISIIILENLSRDIKNVKRAFAVHDNIRALVRIKLYTNSIIQDANNIR